MDKANLPALKIPPIKRTFSKKTNLVLFDSPTDELLSLPSWKREIRLKPKGFKSDGVAVTDFLSSKNKRAIVRKYFPSKAKSKVKHIFPNNNLNSGKGFGFLIMNTKQLLNQNN